MRIEVPQIARIIEELKPGGPTDRNFQAILGVIRDLARIEILDGVYHEGVTLANGANTNVAHKLGRAYRGWIVTNNNQAGEYPAEQTSPDSTRYLTLSIAGGTDTTVDLWIF